MEQISWYDGLHKKGKMTKSVEEVKFLLDTFLRDNKIIRECISHDMEHLLGL